MSNRNFYAALCASCVLSLVLFAHPTWFVVVIGGCAAVFAWLFVRECQKK